MLSKWYIKHREHIYSSLWPRSNDSIPSLFKTQKQQLAIIIDILGWRVPGFKHNIISIQSTHRIYIPVLLNSAPSPHNFAELCRILCILVVFAITANIAAEFAISKANCQKDLRQIAESLQNFTFLLQNNSFWHCRIHYFYL